MNGLPERLWPLKESRSFAMLRMTRSKGVGWGLTVWMDSFGRLEGL